MQIEVLFKKKKLDKKIYSARISLLLTKKAEIINKIGSL